MITRRVVREGRRLRAGRLGAPPASCCAPRAAEAPAARCWWRSSSAARSTGSAWCAARRPGYYRARGRPSRSRRPRRGDARRARPRRLLRAAPALAPLDAALGRTRSLAIVHACGSPDTTRSHFDAQDYMETGTPGVKSTPDGWLPHLRRAPANGHAVPRGGARRRAAAHPAGRRAGARDEPARPVRRPRRRRRPSRERVASSRSTPQAARPAARHRRARRSRRCKMLKAPTPSRLPAGNGAELSARSRSARRCGRSRSSSRRRRPRGRVRRRRRLGHPRRRRARRGPARDAARDFGAALAALVADLGDRMADVVVLTMSEFGRTVARERQPRHRPRPRQRDARRSAAASRRPRVRPMARASPRAALRGPRPRGHHRLPRRLRRDRDAPPRRPAAARSSPASADRHRPASSPRLSDKRSRCEAARPVSTVRAHGRKRHLGS